MTGRGSCSVLGDGSTLYFLHFLSCLGTASVEDVNQQGRVGLQEEKDRGNCVKTGHFLLQI